MDRGTNGTKFSKEPHKGIRRERGYIAKRKAYDYRKGFLLSFFLPIILGFISFLLIFFQKSFVYCGGGVVLASSVVIVIIYTLIKRRDISKQVDPVK